MSLKSHPSGAVGASDPREYASQFRRRCHQLIAFGYGRIRAGNHGRSEEDLITQRLKGSVQAARDEGSLPRWAYRFSIADQAPVSVPGRDAKKRPKIDLEVQSAEAGPRPVYHFEAKRLRHDYSKSVSEYVGKNGLGMFLAEQYGRAGDEGAMLGYVQSDSPAHWAEKIGSKLRAEPPGSYCVTADGAWTEARLTADLDHTYATRHTRPTLGNITIYHTLLDFRIDESQV